MNMNIPTNLKHKPVIVSAEYNKVDGRNADESNVVALSLGLAQMNNRGPVENSAKIWRYTGKKWSSVSEELPIHRVLDLAILVCKKNQFIDQDMELFNDQLRIDDELISERLKIMFGLLKELQEF